MKHLTEEDLILHFYREGDDVDGTQAHLEACAGCRERLQALEHDLNRVPKPAVPFRGADYGSQVWERLAPRLERKKPSWTRWSSRAGWTLALAASLVLAFLAGRIWDRDLGPAPQGIDPAGRQRILAAAAVDHLEKAEVLLLDISQSNSTDPADVERVRSMAQRLLVDNRLLRLSSENSGDWRLAMVLDELERGLLDLAHLSNTDGGTDLAAFQNRVAEDDLTFKVRAVGFQLREQELERARRLARNGS